MQERDDEEIVGRILCRLARLRRRGCAGTDCVVLAARLDVDLDRALELLGRGCTPGLALRILV